MVPLLFHWNFPPAKPHLGPLFISSHWSGNSVHIKQSFLLAFPSKKGNDCSAVSLPQHYKPLPPPSSHGSLRPCCVWHLLRVVPGCQEQRPQRVMRSIYFYRVAFFQGSPSTFQIMKCCCCKWRNWGLNKLIFFLRDTWLMSRRMQPTCFSHFRPIQINAICNLRYGACFLLLSTSLFLTAHQLIIPFPRGCKYYESKFLLSCSSNGELCSTKTGAEGSLGYVEARLTSTPRICSYPSLVHSS